MFQFWMAASALFMMLGSSSVTEMIVWGMTSTIWFVWGVLAIEPPPKPTDVIGSGADAVGNRWLIQRDGQHIPH